MLVVCNTGGPGGSRGDTALPRGPNIIRLLASGSEFDAYSLTGSRVV